jgi:hypothetical protein
MEMQGPAQVAVQEPARDDESWELEDESLERLNDRDPHFFCGNPCAVS